MNPIESRRLVLVSGRLKGIFKICGMIQGEPPLVIHGPLLVGDHILEDVALVVVHDRWVHYVEVIGLHPDKGEETEKTRKSTKQMATG